MLTLSGTPRLSRKLARLCWPFLDRPFGVDALLVEARLAMFERGGGMQRPNLATTTTALDLETLRAEVAEAHRRFDAIVRQLGLSEGAAPPCPESRVRHIGRTSVSRH
ncbi:hypothetical protein [Rhodopila sp.]|uniref:hypothetical protein n=1 Tax=Rhodopila sp. TaxID=2480087 RepID=UPI003D0F181A